MEWRFDGAYGGNLAQMGWVDLGTNTNSLAFNVVLGFGNNENEATQADNGTLSSNLAAVQDTYPEHIICEDLRIAEERASVFVRRY
jgi:glucoamylase